MRVRWWGVGGTREGGGAGGRGGGRRCVHGCDERKRGDVLVLVF